MLRDPHFEMFVTYLEGSALVEKDLLRAQASTAVAIFIMTNKFSEDADEEDAKTILQHLSIKRYAESSMQQAPRNQLYCMQLIRPENQRHLPTRTNSSATNLVICLNEVGTSALLNLTCMRSPYGRPNEINCLLTCLGCYSDFSLPMQ